MSERLERLAGELQKARSKKNEWDRKVKELEQKYREEEKTEVHGIVKAANLNPERLAKIIALAEKYLPGNAPKEELMKIMEGTENEQENN